jgi:phosphoglycolate phosphatase
MHGEEAHYWYVGDTVGDVVEGRQAGARTVAVTWGWHDENLLRGARPDHVASSPHELVELIDRAR